MASLNLHWGLGLRGQPYDVAAAVCQLDAEVICLQEAWLQVPTPAAGIASARADDLAEAAAKLGAALHREVMCRRPALTLRGVSADCSGPGELSIAMLTTLPVTAYEVIELGLAPRDDVPRFAQVLTLALAHGASVRVVNTHLTHRFTSPVQLRRLRRRLQADAAASPQAPTMIVGDLNMPRIVAGMSTEFAATARGKTWPVKRPLVQLDHILAGRGIEFLRGGVLPAVGSDHLPIRARMAVSRLA